MKKILSSNWLMGFIIAIISMVYLNGIAQVPFHPDEQTQIFMSGDLEQLFIHPYSLFWQPDQHQDLRLRYRELDPPLTRWIIGIGRMLAGIPAPTVDWDWTKDWEANQAAGALPSPHLLVTSRLSVALLFPISLFLMFQIGKSLGGIPIAWLNMLALSSNALVLLHTRRAMAESALLCTAILTLWAIGQFQHNTIWLGIPAALAFNSKYLNAPLMILCLLAIIFQPTKPRQPTIKVAFQIFQFLFIFMIITLALNPFLWNHPWSAIQDAWQQRNEFVNQQVRTYGYNNPDLVWRTIPERIIGLFINLFINKPAIADVANYIKNTHLAESAYYSNPLTWFSRGVVTGGILIILTIYGFITAFLRIKRENFNKQRYLGLLWIGTIIQSFALLLFNPLPFQRYVMPLIPFVCIWMSFGLDSLGRLGILLYRQFRRG
ncbi:MAG: hypothetical protein ACPL0B_00925 [Anaerolineales bacterium]